MPEKIKDFIALRMQEGYTIKNKNLYICFINPEKVFDRAHHPILEWALRKRMGLEGLVMSVMALYEDAQTKVKYGSDLCESLLGMGVHQGSFLSPLMFFTVIDVLFETLRKDVLWNLLYVNDLVLMAESMQQLERYFNNWKNTFERRFTLEMKSNIYKTCVRSAIVYCV